MTETLTKRLAGPSTAKAGMDSVDQAKVNEIIYKASEVCFRAVHALTRDREVNSLETNVERMKN